MSRKSIKKNYLYNLAYQILTLILPFITTPYISRMLGAEAIGIYSYTTSIVAYFTLIGSLGISLYGQREIAYIGDDKTKLKKTFFEIITLRLITLLIAGIVFVVCFLRQGEYQIYYQILFLEIVAAALDIGWFFHGVEDFKRTVIRNIVVRLVSVSLIFILVKSPEDLSLYMLIYSLSNLLGNLSLWFYLPKMFKGIKVPKLSILRHLIPVCLLFIPQITNQVYTIIDNTILGAFIPDKAELGYYEQAQKIVRILVTIVTSLGAVMLPRIANTFANGTKKELIHYIRKSFNFTFLLGFPIMFGIIAVSREFVPIFLGANYEKSALLINILAPTIIFLGISNVLGTQYLLATKRQKEYTLAVLTGLIIDVVLNVIFVKKYMSVGVSVATIIAQIVVMIIQINYVKREINITRILLDNRRYFFMSLIMFIACTIVGHFITNPMISTIVKVIVGGITYLSLLIVTKDQNLNYIKKFKRN